MFAEEPMMEQVHGLCCDALKIEHVEPVEEHEDDAEIERPKYSLPCD